MAWELFSYDPLTGVRTLYDYDEERDLGIFRREEDVSGILKVAAETRATRTPMTYAGTDDEVWWPEAIIPATVMAEMLKRGIDVGRMEGRDATALAREIELNYPHLKLTDKKLWRPT